VLVEDGGHTVTFENDSGELIPIDKLEVSTPDFSPHRFRVADERAESAPQGGTPVRSR
jgi:hypothetical protein